MSYSSILPKNADSLVANTSIDPRNDIVEGEALAHLQSIGSSQDTLSPIPCLDIDSLSLLSREQIADLFYLAFKRNGDLPWDFIDRHSGVRIRTNAPDVNGVGATIEEAGANPDNLFNIKDGVLKSYIILLQEYLKAIPDTRDSIDGVGSFLASSRIYNDSMHRF